MLGWLTYIWGLKDREDLDFFLKDELFLFSSTWVYNRKERQIIEGFNSGVGVAEPH